MDFSQNSPLAGTPKISCIIPVYNVEKYLRECVDSVLAQTFTDFELILVDDGSPDASGKICDDYAKKDARVRVFHKPNGGVSSARNLGLDQVRGEWICFIDSDDKIAPSMFEQFFRASSPDVDLVFADGSFSAKNAPRTTAPEADVPAKKFPKIKILAGILTGGFCGWSPYCKLFRGEIIREFQLRFCEEISMNEDTLFCVRFAKKIRAGTRIPQPVSEIYFWRENEASLTHRATPRQSRDLLRGEILLDKEFGDNDAYFSPLLARRKAKSLCFVIRRAQIPRAEILPFFSKISTDGLPLTKKIVLRVYASPAWFLCVPAMLVFNFLTKLKRAK